jgi:hypothetical protein
MPAVVVNLDRATFAESIRSGPIKSRESSIKSIIIDYFRRPDYTERLFRR